MEIANFGLIKADSCIESFIIADICTRMTMNMMPKNSI